MSTFIETTPQILSDIVKQITNRLLEKNLREKANSYMKIDFNVLQQNEFFSIQITKCSCGTINFKSLLKNAIKGQSDSKNFHKKTIATVYEKTLNRVRQQNVRFNKNLSISLVAAKVFEEQKDLCCLKCYSSIKLLFQVKNVHLQMFMSVITSHIKLMEKIHPNIKLLFRKDQQCIYRNQTRMDDIILSCRIVNSSCANVFYNSLKNSYRQELIKELGIRKSRNFDNVLGCLFLSQTDNNFNDPNVSPKNGS